MQRMGELSPKLEIKSSPHFAGRTSASITAGTGTKGIDVDYLRSGHPDQPVLC